mgnify:CR=1 FL=1
MQRVFRVARVLLAMAGMMLVTSSPLLAGQFGDYKPHGFLSDYSGLKPEGGESKAYLYLQEGVDRTRYKKVMVDRIKIFFKEDSEYKGIDPAELKDLADYFHDAIKKALGNAYPVVRNPGPDVLHLRVAVTDLVPNKPEASLVTLAVPCLWMGAGGAGVAEGEAGSTPFAGEASIELEVLDSISHAQVAAFIETRSAKKYNWTHGAGEAATSYLKAYSTWAYTKKAMDHWAQMIRGRLDKAHGKAKAD